MDAARTQERATATRAALTEAARVIFLRDGYDAAAVTDIVGMAGSSVGSLYHHFDGKSDLWLAVYREHQLGLQHHVADAFDSAAGGDHDAFEIFLIGTRAYLDACWERRALVLLFAAGDHPPGYGTEIRRQFDHWLESNIRQLRGLPQPLGRTLVLALTTLAQTAGLEVARQPTRRRARTVSTEFLDVMQRLYPS
jgi:AcrR family transcriptional regulator